MRACAYCRYDAGVAVERDHPVQVEDVVLGPRRWTGRRTSPRRCRPRSAIRSRSSAGSSGFFSSTMATASLDRLVQQLDQPDRLAGAGLERLAVGARAPMPNCDVHAPRRRRAANRPRRAVSKTMRKCSACAGVDDVEDPVGVQVADPVADRRPGRWPRSRSRRRTCARSAAAGSPSRPLKPSRNTHSAPSLRTASPRSLQLGDDLGEVRGCRSSRRRCRRRSGARRAARRPPRSSAWTRRPARCHSRQRLRVAALQRHHPLPGPVGELGVGVEAARGRRGRGGQPGDGDLAGVLGAGRTRLGVLDQVLDEHAELRAPVAEVVLADHACGRRTPAAGPARRR